MYTLKEKKKKRMTLFLLILCSPAEDAQDEIEHEEGSYHDKRHEVNPVDGAAHSVIGLPKKNGRMD